MKKVSRAYKQAMNKMIRDHSYMIVTVGVISNEAQATARVSSETSYLSDNKSLFKDNAVSDTYATLEEDFFKLDGSMIFPPMNTGYQQLVNNIACISENVGEGITIEFANAYDIKGLTLAFGENYPTRFTVKTSDNTETTYDNSLETFTTDDSFNATKTITITPLMFKNRSGNKRLRIESMLMGIGIVFQNEDIESANFTDSKSFISEELPQIDFNVTCFDKNKRFRVDDRNSFINYLETGQEISVSMGMELEDETIEWLNMPLTYLSTWASNNNKIAFTSTDRFALLTEKYTIGNTIHSRTLYAEAESVLQDAGLQPDEYVISDILRTITIINPMPEVSHAEALQLIANAGRCILEQGEHGEIKFTPNFENILEPNDIEVNSESHTFWSNPQSIVRTGNVVYADMTDDIFALDGSTFFIPPKNQAVVLDSGYVSEQISNGNGYFYTNLLFPDKRMDEKFKFKVDSAAYYVENIWQNHPIAKGTYLFSGVDLTVYEDISLSLIIDILNEPNGSQVIGGYELTFDDPYAFVTVDNDTYCNVYVRVVSQGDLTNTTFSMRPSLVSISETDIDSPEEDLAKIEFWGTKPKLSLKLSIAYTFYGINLLFANPISSFTITTYAEGTLIDTLDVDSESDNQTLFEIAHSFYSFDEMVIEINSTIKPYQRALLQQLSFGKLSEYELPIGEMKENAIGTVGEKVQSVGVKVYTFEEGTDGQQPKALDDNVYSIYTVNTTGSNPTFGNQLISTQEHALEVAKWLANYYANNITYEVNYRGEPRIDAGDYIFLESEVLNNLQVEVESHTINFNGALSGTLSLRRAANLVSD